MPTPLICTNNSLLNIDYGIPIVANKSTDYRTTTGTYHRFMSSMPQEFDCRVKANIKPGLLDQDVALKDDLHTTVYKDSYYYKLSPVNPAQKCYKPPRAQSVACTRTVQEKIFNDPPPPRQAKLSEMKDEYRQKFFVPDRREVYPPEITEKCEIKGLCRDEQPPIRPEQKGYWKYLDIYLTTNRESYIPFSQDEIQRAEEDLVTFYNISGQYKGSSVQLPGRDGNKSVWDKSVFKVVYPPRVVPKTFKRVPHSGKQTEYNGNYFPQTFSKFYPYISDSSAVFCETLGVGGPWQNLCPPSMYFTEYDNIMSKRCVNYAVNVGQRKKYLYHEPCDKKVTDRNI